MNTSPPAIIDSASVHEPGRNGKHAEPVEHRNGFGHPHLVRPPDPETLRHWAWLISEQRAGDHFAPASHHIALAAVSPYQGFLHWRIHLWWVEQTARHKGAAWDQCVLIARLYDVSYIEFNGLNANAIIDLPLGGISGQLLFKLPRPGTWQLAEVGFRLRNGEFIPAARSHAVPFPTDAVSPRHSHTALLVDDKWHVEEVGNLWEQDKVLYERRKPKLKKSLTIAAFAFEAQAAGHQGAGARFVSELASSQAAQGHQVHVFVPAGPQLRSATQAGDVTYHPLEIQRCENPLDQALHFARAAEERLQQLPNFDLFHLHEWMTGLAPWIGTRPTVLSLSSLEVTRRNGAPPSPLSLEIQQTEQSLAHAVGCVLTPDWLRARAIAEFGVDTNQVHAFPMEARQANEWEMPLDFGQVKKDIGFGPLDRLMLFVGPLEWDSGVDLLIEALPVLQRRCGSLRFAFAGTGSMHGALEHRARELGVGWAVRLLGHVDRHRVTRLLRAAEALILPARNRVPWDDAVVDLARLAGRPVVTTQGGPAYLVNHGHNGLVTYDNPGSMVWAIDRILHDPGHAEQMGQNGKRTESATPVGWSEVGRQYLELCAQCFPELRGTD